jgi:hypothetical protein
LGEKGLDLPGSELTVTDGIKDDGLILSPGSIQSFKIILYSVCVMDFLFCFFLFLWHWKLRVLHLLEKHRTT